MIQVRASSCTPTNLHESERLRKKTCARNFNS